MLKFSFTDVRNNFNFNLSTSASTSWLETVASSIKSTLFCTSTVMTGPHSAST